MSALLASSPSSATSPAQLQAPSPLATRIQSNIVDDFFGASASRHDRPISGERDSSFNVMPPPYSGEDSELPAYTREPAEPVTLAMFLFKFGFLFPLFWVIGAFLLLSPLRAPPSRVEEDGTPAAWLPEKTDAERQAIIDRMRSVEVKWAKRCLWALLSLLTIALIVGIACWMVLTH
jgi:hypothetical protein